MSLQKQKQKDKSQMFIYVMTLGEFSALIKFLEKVSQLGWLETSTNSSPSLLFKLGNEQMVTQDGS